MVQCKCCGYEMDVRSPKRKVGLIGGLMRLVLVYAAMVFAAGTLKQVQHPVAREAGQLIQTVSMIDPAIRSTREHGWHRVSNALSYLAAGAPLNRIVG